MSDAEPLIPDIADEDIDWVCSLLELDPFDEPRRRFLMRRSTVDVSACPGSGKTTLIVAKLAILARKWPHRTKGICVLSHTNVAREEIQHRLGRTVVGQRLLSYPHFIDTIHGFVNRFLALPWLYSNGFPSPTIDNDVTTAYRRGVLGNKDYWTVQNFLANKHNSFDNLRICARDLSFDLSGKAFPASSSAASFQNAKCAVEAAARAGYFCYDEMFVWANALIEDYPSVPEWLASRFPLIIVDEMQDTFNRQGSLLNAVFPRSSGNIIVQRVGDPNQEIFDTPDSSPDPTDPFPDPDAARCLGIPNSYRFGPEIASLASPFAVQPVGPEGLCGIGPKGTGDAPAQRVDAIFVFPDDSTKGILDAYGKHALAVLDEQLLAKGVVTAVGAVHQDAPEVTPQHAHFPKTVSHYWCGYTPEISRKDPHPRTLVQYIRAARAVARDTNELSPGVEKIASGIVRLAGRIGDTETLKRKARTHRAVVEALAAERSALAAYRQLLTAFLIECAPLTAEVWPAYQDAILGVACALCDGDTDADKAGEFLAWPGEDASLAVVSATSSNDAGPNIYRVTQGTNTLDIRLGSIHSVKGQTHLATMLLSTHWHDHSSKKMIPWFLGKKENKAGAGKRDTQRLLHTYVAMTRPSHLLCLAIPRSTLGVGDAIDQNIQTLKGKGWRVAKIVDGFVQWQD